MIKILTFIIFVGLVTSASAIYVTDMSAGNYTADSLVDLFVSGAVQTSNKNLISTSNSAGTYTDAVVEAQGNPFMTEGIVLSSGDVNYLNSNMNAQERASRLLGLGPDQDLQSLLPTSPFVIPSYDATILEFDFEPQVTGSASFTYVFGSEEYFNPFDPDYNNFADVFGLFFNGDNIALVPNTSTPVSTQTINENVNSEFFNPNEYNGGDPSPFASEMNGFTTPLTTSFDVESGELYHLKLGITDAHDLWWDSYLCIGKESFVLTEVPEEPTTPEGGGGDVPVPEPSLFHLGLLGLGCLLTMYNRKSIA